MPTQTIGNFRVSGTTDELAIWREWRQRSTFPWERIDRMTTVEFLPANQMPALPPSVGSGPRQGNAIYSQMKVQILRGMPRARTLYVIGHEHGHVPLDAAYLVRSQRDDLTALMEPASVANSGWTAGASDRMPAEIFADRCGELLVYPKIESPFDNDVVYQGTIPDGRAGAFLDILFTPPDYEQIQRQLVATRAVALAKTQEVGQVTEALTAKEAELAAVQAALAECEATQPPDECADEIARLTLELIACRAAGDVKDADIVRYRGALEAIEDRAASALMGEGDPA
jgi:hypothetical protein